MTTEWNAREVLILEMLAGFGSNVANPTIDAMVRVCLPYPIEAIRQACERFSNKEVDGHDYRFPPNAPQLVDQVRLLDRVLSRVAARNDGLIAYPIGGKPPDGTAALGPVEVDFGNGRIDMRGMTAAEKEVVLANKGLPAPQIEGARFTPHVKRMIGE